MVGISLSTKRYKRTTFPDIKSSVPQGRFSGLALGIQTAMAQGQLNRYNAMNDVAMGLQMRRQGLSERQFEFKTKPITPKSDKSWISILNNANKQITSLNKEIAKANAVSNIQQSLIPYMSLDEIVASGGKININQSMPVGGGLMPSRPQQNIWGKIGGALKTARKGILGFAEGGIVDRPQMAMVGEQGKEYIAPASKLDPATQAKLEGILGKPDTQQPGNNNASNAMQGPSTEDLIAALDDYDNIDEAIADLVELDRQYNQPGFQVADNIDYEAFKQAFIAKFGEAGYRKLEASVQ